MKKPKCPECKSVEHVKFDSIPQVCGNGRVKSAPAWLCEMCALLFLWKKLN